jgi:putative tricarboxylic transport membrane protein
MSVESDSFSSGSPPPSARVDLITAAVFIAFGIGVLLLALGMPTFTDRGGDPYTAPGIVPGFYGVVLAGLSLVLALRAIRRGALGREGGPVEGAETAPAGTYSNARLAIVAVLGLVYTVGLVGRVPFWLASAIFISAFIIAFEWEPPVGRWRRVALALLIGAIGGGAIHAVFQQIFLVRLP